ncbi:TIR domain-containing protein [Accumulibacter sp.]|uniref:TIR domain-containing protein n=1 Tax=Accumulibacter sp. TaxID=2053492 RepID=UPI0028C50C8E|nr:TIR domain-containing protein [Accumulibacter sp.]
MRTPLQENLRDRLNALQKLEELWSAFAKAWAAESQFTTTAPVNAEALLNDCLQRDPLEVLESIRSLAPELGKLAATPGRTPEVLRQVAIGIGLVACERRVREKFALESIGVSAAAADEMLIAASEQLAAAVIAAAWCANGVRVHFDEQTRRAEAVNVLRDVPPQELDFQGGRECVKAELQAMLKTPLDELAGGDRRTRLHDVKTHGVVSDDVLLSQLNRYARKNGARPMFGLNAASAHALDEPKLREEFATRFGVPTFRYGDAAKQRLGEIDSDAWKRANLQADLMNYLSVLFELLSAQAAQARPALHDMHFRVALSLAGEQREYVDGVAAGLAEELGPDAVFYYPNFEALLCGFNRDRYLQTIYRDQSDLIVVFLSGDYQAKEWCGGVEWRVVCDLIKKGQEQRIMPFRFDDQPVDGLFSIDLTIDCNERTPDRAAELIIERLAATPPRA